MIKKHRHGQVRSRNEEFTQRTATKIWDERPSDDNPYIASTVKCHGYDLFELLKKKSFVDVFFLLFKGELPSSEESELLEALMIGLINPGPRHAATRAAMNAGVGKTNPIHILPIGLSVLGGNHHGAGIVDAAMRFFRKNQKQDALLFAKELMQRFTANKEIKSDDKTDFFCDECPGFGSLYGGIDLISENLVEVLVNKAGAGPALKWGVKVSEISQESGVGWLSTGIASAVFADLGFHPRIGGSLFQLIRAPGIAAHGIELANKHFTAMPFVKDEDYLIEENT